MNIKLCEFCTISPTINFFSNKFVLSESVLTFEPAIRLVCSINLKKLVPDEIKDGGRNCFSGFYDDAFPNVFRTTHGCELALNICRPKIDECFCLKKAHILCFTSNQRNATVHHLEVVYRIETIFRGGYNVGYSIDVSIQFCEFYSNVG